LGRNYFPNYGVQTQFTTGTTNAVNGACGTANGLSFSALPSANLCSAGTASAVGEPYTAGSYGWAWSCNGEYGGTNASCSATATGTPTCATRLSSLVSLWPGNDNANDVGPGGNNGTLENGVTYALGEVGDAFNFSTNSSTADEYVLIGQPVPPTSDPERHYDVRLDLPTALPANDAAAPSGSLPAASMTATSQARRFTSMAAPTRMEARITYLRATSASTSVTERTGMSRTRRRRCL